MDVLWDVSLSFTSSKRCISLNRSSKQTSRFLSQAERRIQRYSFRSSSVQRYSQSPQSLIACALKIQNQVHSCSSSSVQRYSRSLLSTAITSFAAIQSIASQSIASYSDHFFRSKTTVTAVHSSPQSVNQSGSIRQSQCYKQ